MKRPILIFFFILLSAISVASSSLFMGITSCFDEEFLTTEYASPPDNSSEFNILYFFTKHRGTITLLIGSEEEIFVEP